MFRIDIPSPKEKQRKRQETNFTIVENNHKVLQTQLHND